MAKKKQPLIYLVNCSIRAGSKREDIVDNVKKISNEPSLYRYIEKVARSGIACNSEIALIASAFGALEWTKNVEYIRLNEYFLPNGRTKDIPALLEKLKKGDGFIFSTPVYFGDRSSLLHELIETLKKERFNFFGKVSGFISVGAKRNGGQETTNIYALHNFSELGSLVVGNGPPTSQFGGTCVGGNKGTMENDYFGIMTSTGVGRKVAQTSLIVKEGISLYKKKKPNIIVDFWILEDKDKQLENYIKNIIKEIASKTSYRNVNFKILNLIKYNFSRCFACNVCPNTNNKKLDYKCINKKDDMRKIHRRILRNDVIIVSGLSLSSITGIKSVYQRFIERTRYLRRDNFRLTNRLVAAFSLNEIGGNTLFNVRVLTSFIRHNTIFHKGFENYILNGSLVNSPRAKMLKFFDSLIKLGEILKLGKEKVDIGEQKYISVGY